MKTCGKCKKTWEPDNFVEEQECLHKRDTGGFGSVFGDMTTWSVTLCQTCAFEMFEPYLIVHEEGL